MKKYGLGLCLIAFSIAVATFSTSSERESSTVILQSHEQFDCIIPFVALADCQIFDQPVVKIGFPVNGEVVEDGFVPAVQAASNSPPAHYMD